MIANAKHSRLPDYRPGCFSLVVPDTDNLAVTLVESLRGHCFQAVGAGLTS